MLKKLLLFIILIVPFIALPIDAACWCTSPKDNCACGSTGSEFREPFGPANADAGFKDGEYFDTSYQGISLRCNTREEANSVFAKVSPICINSVGPEIVPACAKNLEDPSDLICYGSSFALGDSNVPLSTGEGRIEVTKVGISDGTVKFNGKSYPNTAHVKVCEGNTFCCSRAIQDDLNKPNYFLWCSGDGVPQFLPETNICGPQRSDLSTVPPPENICGYQGPQAGESRIFIPHLRNISALATLLQTMYNPFPSLFIKNALPSKDTITSGVDNKNAVVSQIDYHQGVDDSTPKVTEAYDNSSLVVGKVAPASLYDFSGSDPYNNSGMCTIADTKYNAGDDLLGPEVTATFAYTQKYNYPVAPKPAGCVLDNETRNSTQKCCSEYEGNGYASLAPNVEFAGNPLDPTSRVLRCATRSGQDLPTKGQVAVFTKTPLIEYIYDVLVMGPQSVFRRIMPQNVPEEIKEIPSQANFSASATNVGGSTVDIAAGTGDQPTVYFPHIGSLYIYFLQGIQQAIRPLMNIATRTPEQSQSQAESSLKDIAERYGVPWQILDAVWSIETGRSTEIQCSCENGRACGQMQIGEGAYRAVLKNGETLDRCKLPDAFELAARVLLWKKYCLTSGCTYDRENPTSQGGLDIDELYVVGRYNGSNDCAPNNETQCRWGPGYSYCHAVTATINGITLPTPNQQTTDIFCRQLSSSPTPLPTSQSTDNRR